MKETRGKRKEYLFLASQFLLGLLYIAFGVYFIMSEHNLWFYVMYAVVGLMVVTIVLFAYRAFTKRSGSDGLIAIGAGVFLLIVLTTQEGILGIVALFFGVWALFNAFSHALEIYVAFINGKVFPLAQTFYLLFEVTLGVLLLLNHTTSFGIVNLEIGLYVILIGVTQIASSLRVFFQNKTSLHLPAPVFISAILPTLEVRRTRKIRQIKQDYITHDIARTKANEVSIFIYSNENGFDSMGHMAIGYQGSMYSYGNHDPYNRAKSLVFGDGVMIVGDEVDYVRFAVDGGHTVFRFTCSINDEQSAYIEERLDTLFEDAYVYDYPIEMDKKQQHYLTKALNFGCKGTFYKFSKGKFKTYSVLTTNCVLITDYIFQTTGMRFFQISGIVTPGAYYDYLNGVLNKPGSIVVKKDIYQK